MKTTGIHLSWVVVKDLSTALDFYTRVVGLTLLNESPEYGWAELAGPGGMRLGIAQENPQMPQKAGSNAVVTVTVSDMKRARAHFLSQGATLVGEVCEVPGHVRLQTFTDVDGNHMQLVQELS